MTRRNLAPPRSRSASLEDLRERLAHSPSVKEALARAAHWIVEELPAAAKPTALAFELRPGSATLHLAASAGSPLLPNRALFLDRIGFGDPEDRVCVRVERDPKSPVLQAVAAALGATRAVHFVPVLGPARPWGAFAVAVTGDLGEDSAAEPLLLAARAMSGVLASGLGVSPPAPRAEVSRRSLEALLNLTLASESRARAGSGVAVYALPPTAIPGLSVGRVVRAFLDSTRPTEHVAPIGGDAVGMGFQIADSARRERVMARVRANLAKIGAPVERLAVVLAVPSAREAGALLADALAISRASA